MQLSLFDMEQENWGSDKIMAYLLEETLKFPKDSFKSMKYQPYELKPNFSMYRVYEWHTYWSGAVYVSFSGGLDSTVLAYIVCLAYRKYKLTGTIPLVFSDTGTEFPEIRKFVKDYVEWLKGKFPELDIRLEIVRPKHSFRWVLENKGFPIISKETAGKIRKLRHGNLSDKYREYLLRGDERGKFGMLAKKWQYLADTKSTKEDISEQCCDVLKKEPLDTYSKKQAGNRLSALRRMRVSNERISTIIPAAISMTDTDRKVSRWGSGLRRKSYASWWRKIFRFAVYTEKR